MARNFDRWFSDAILIIVGTAVIAVGLGSRTSASLEGSLLAFAGVCILGFGANRIFRRMAPGRR